ncbi:unnamed protein product [Bursaphelenchus xylophilus]|uniref:(pine wood nematode) hypothetical protein n=1 Tax=Bursaphelenchus xylophilus TaxID=6326 RepID=A0A1I7S1Y7_BURXY|nr:unnamed protein product [Bursaphelenchus xylophilus]CAG9090121.1 unnamed protein product [Bursaphelenchus xylophilus]
MLLFTLFLRIQADCGCGMRCIKYSTALQCTRCCTATVRRSAPLLSEDEQLAHVPTRALEKLLQTLGAEKESRKLLKLRSQRRNQRRLQHETLTDIVENILAERRS